MEISLNAALIEAVNKMLTERECQPCQKYDACEYCDTNITIKKLTELKDTYEEEEATPKQAYNLYRREAWL